MNKILRFLLALSLVKTASSCKSQEVTCCDASAPYVTLLGSEQWAWVKTVTPTGTITADSTGWTKTLNFFSRDGKGFLTYYENEKLREVYVNDRNFYAENREAYAFTLSYLKRGYVTVYLKNSRNNYPTSFEVTAFSETFPMKVDTVRHTYRRVGALANTALE